MKGMHLLAGALASLAVSVCAWSADIRTIVSSQFLERPAGQTFTEFARNVAIDGAEIIVLATHHGGQSALHYHRASRSSKFTYRRTLVTFLQPQERMSVKMKNGIAVVQFGDREWIFERSGSNYVAGPVDTQPRHPGGVAISTDRILFGGDNCGYDGVIYQKATDGVWRITGRLDDNQGQCAPDGLAVELNYDTALIHVPGTRDVTTWQRNGSAIDWVRGGSLVINSEVASTSQPFALQNSTAVTPASYVFRRQGSGWAAAGRVVPADYGMGAGNARAVKYRDSKLVTSESWIPDLQAGLYVYLENAPGYFEHVAILPTYVPIRDHDVSGRTVIAGIDGGVDGGEALIYTLPEPLTALDRIAADFQDGDASAFSPVSGQFALAARGSNRVLAQSAAAGSSVALVEESDSNYYQRIEALIMPTFGTTDGWVGLIARYVDANNYYYYAVRKDGTSGLYRRVGGVDTLLAETRSFAGTQRVGLAVDDDRVAAWIDRQYYVSAVDRSLPRGRVGLVTRDARADFDDVLAAFTGQTQLVWKRFVPDADVAATPTGREFKRIGGDWQFIETNPGYYEGYQQRNPERSSFAYLGAFVRNQEIETSVRVDAVSSEIAAWVGLLGRYVDAQNHYFVRLRTNGGAEICKRVDNVITTLASAKHGVNTRQYNALRFRMVGDQLQLFVNDRLLLSAHDDAIAEGAHGLATSRAAATWEYLKVIEP